MIAAFRQLLELELHRHERIWVRQLQRELTKACDEDKLDRIIVKTLEATSRLARSHVAFL